VYFWLSFFELPLVFFLFLFLSSSACVTDHTRKLLGTFPKIQCTIGLFLVCRQIFISAWFLRERKKPGIRSQLGARGGRVVRSRASSSQASRQAGGQRPKSPSSQANKAPVHARAYRRRRSSSPSSFSSSFSFALFGTVVEEEA
jgi:hypothetical protein